MNKTIALILTTAITAVLSEPSAIASAGVTVAPSTSVTIYPPLVHDGKTEWNYRVNEGHGTKMYVQGTGARTPLQKPHYTIGQSTADYINFHFSIPKKTGPGPFDNGNTHIRWKYNIKEEKLEAVAPTGFDAVKLHPSIEERKENEPNALAFIKALVQAQRQ